MDESAFMVTGFKKVCLWFIPFSFITGKGEEGVFLGVCACVRGCVCERVCVCCDCVQLALDPWITHFQQYFKNVYLLCPLKDWANTQRLKAPSECPHIACPQLSAHDLCLRA